LHLYDGRQTLAKGDRNPKPARHTPPITRKLTRNKDIDCINRGPCTIIGTSKIAGRYREPAGRIVLREADGHTLRAGKVSRWPRPAEDWPHRADWIAAGEFGDMPRQRSDRQGAIGDVCLVEGSLGRNDPTAPGVPSPTDLSPQTLDGIRGRAPPEAAFDPLIYARWRCWKEYAPVSPATAVHSGKVAYLYGSVLNEHPAGDCHGGILRWKTAGHAACMRHCFEYGNLPVSPRLNLGTESRRIVRFQGSKESIEVTDSLYLHPAAGNRYFAKLHAYGFFREKMREEYFKQAREHDPPSEHNRWSEARPIVARL